MSQPPEYRAHQEWLGYVQPVGLVVSIPALLAAEAYVNRNISAEHQAFLATLPRDAQDEVLPEILDFRAFAQTVLGWEASDLVPAPDALSVSLPAYNEVLSPTFAVPDSKSKEAEKPWLMVVQCLERGTDFDANTKHETQQWEASPNSKLELLLQKTSVPIGLLFNHTHLRLIYKPPGENSGHITFAVQNMIEVAGRPIFAALQMLLHADRLFVLPEKQRLPNILAESRKYQNVVSTKLAEQVLAALYELVHGFQAADAQRHGDLLREILKDDPNQVYAGLLTVLLRLVFVLYAEDRDLLSRDDVYTRFYSITGLYARLREDAGRYHDTMEQRYGAWAQLLVLFRMVYDGARHGKLQLPPREGYLFDPDRYPFLEGRAYHSQRESGERLTVPHVSDGVVYRVLQNLLILDGERLSYRSLDVEHIGGVYETMMGFNLEVAVGRSIAIKPTKSHGAPATINLDALLAQKPADRAKWLKEQSDQALTGQAADALKWATTIEELLAALEKKIARHATAHVVPPGAMILQPSDERRRSGSHYTPRSLTEPIVRTTLRPILERLSGQVGSREWGVGSEVNAEGSSSENSPLPTPPLPTSSPTPDQLLDLKICDPAMGSGAFLVEACRQLATELVAAWHAHRCVPQIPPDEDEEKHAMRIVAQRCLYGVDKNPLAVDLAKLSLWLATLAREHPFTFLDHNLKHGDSLVGLTQRQIENFTWEQVESGEVGVASKKKSKRASSSNSSLPTPHSLLFSDPIKTKLRHALSLRHTLLSAPENEAYALMRQRLAHIDENLDFARLAGDLVIAAFFSSEKDKDRQARLAEYAKKLTQYLGDERTRPDLLMRTELAALARALRTGIRPLPAFHWEIEFPEVFLRENGGFDAIVGNPPFAGKNTLIEGSGSNYLEWLKAIHEEAHGNADLVAHFFRRSFNSLRIHASLGLLATNTIGQGDTRSTGLRWICTNGGTIYNARKRVKWPGQAAVMVSVVHIMRGKNADPVTLNGRTVPRVSAYLFHAGPDDDPMPLVENVGRSSVGTYALGLGFVFDDDDKSGQANSTQLMSELIAKNPRCTERIFPYIGGEAVNESPTHKDQRLIVDFGALAEEECRTKWPELMQLLELKVKPTRAHDNRESYRRLWWQFAEKRQEIYRAIERFQRIIVTSQVSKFRNFAILDADQVFDQRLVIFAFDDWLTFGLLQSQVHAIWEGFLGVTLEDRPTYTPSACFYTFPRIRPGESHSVAQAAEEYYEFRAALMVKNDEGLTKTYNRFHDRDETSTEIFRLRELHAAMDRAVLEAYGWHDLADRATCEFLLDYEEEDDEDDSPPTGKRKKKKPWRYRWPDDFRDEVLARLLELNKQRAEEERKAGLAAAAAQEQANPTKTKPPSPRSRKKQLDTPKLPGME